MPRFDIFERIAEQRVTGRAFAIVTVIRTADATSAKAGFTALVTARGEIVRHVDSGWVRRTVRMGRPRR